MSSYLNYHPCTTLNRLQNVSHLFETVRQGGSFYILKIEHRYFRTEELAAAALTLTVL